MNKPHIRYSPKARVWFCYLHGNYLFGSGKTPVEAFNDFWRMRSGLVVGNRHG